jgi:hypothetical protein
MFFPMPVRMGFVVQSGITTVFLPVLWTQKYPVGIIPPVLHKDIFIHLLQIFLTTDSVAKYILNKHCIQVVELGTIWE